MFDSTLDLDTSLSELVVEFLVVHLFTSSMCPISGARYAFGSAAMNSPAHTLNAVMGKRDTQDASPLQFDVVNTSIRILVVHVTDLEIVGVGELLLGSPIRDRTCDDEG